MNKRKKYTQPLAEIIPIRHPLMMSQASAAIGSNGPLDASLTPFDSKGVKDWEDIKRR